MRLPTTVKNLLLVGLLVADIVLVVAVVQGAQTPSAQAARTTTPHPAATTSTTSSAPAPGPTPPSVTAMVLDVVGPKTAWRATPGSCADGGAVLERTTDGGATWARVDAPFRAVTRISASSASAGFVVGAEAADCKLSVRSTTDVGGSWKAPGRLSSTWYADIEDRASVHTAGDHDTTPCAKDAVRQLTRVTDDVTAVLCDDGTVRATTDGGSSWAVVGQQDGAVAMAASHDTAWTVRVAALGQKDCAGVQVLSLAAAGPTVTGCIETGVKAGDPVALGREPKDADHGWAVVGATTYRSSDGLATWTTAG